MIRFYPTNQLNDNFSLSSDPSFVFETKYYVKRNQKNVLLALLKNNAKRPDHYQKSSLRTIYFDSLDQHSFLEGKDGQLYKKKYRLREYMGISEGAFYSLEIKLRHNLSTSKIKKLIYKPLPLSFRITTFRNLIGVLEEIIGESLPLFRLESSQAELYPTVEIIYDRYRFEDWNGISRYNLDCNISAGKNVSAALGAKYKRGYPLNHDLFEIKGKSVSRIPAFLNVLNIEPFSFSKFIWGNELVNNLA